VFSPPGWLLTDYIPNQNRRSIPMQFSPWCVIFLCLENPCVGVLQNLVAKIPDTGLEVRLPLLVSDILPFNKNKIIHEMEAHEIKEWRKQITGCHVCVNWNPKLFPAATLAQEMSSLPKKMRRNFQLLVNDCTPEDFIGQNIIFLFMLFPAITLTNEYEDGHYAMPIALSLQKHRRPCKYPFWTVVIDEEQNVRACPYSEDVITRFSTWNNLLSDQKYRLFLASHLMGTPSLSTCRDCLYWLDGWLGNETTSLTSSYGHSYRLSWEGHGCQIQLVNEK